MHDIQYDGGHRKVAPIRSGLGVPANYIREEKFEVDFRRYPAYTERKQMLEAALAATTNTVETERERCKQEAATQA